MAPGTYQVVAYARSVVSGKFDEVAGHRVIVSTSSTAGLSGARLAGHAARGGSAMNSRLTETPRYQQDRDYRRANRTTDEPRHFDAAPHENPTRLDSAHAGFDAELNPIDDELINTHGSER